MKERPKTNDGKLNSWQMDQAVEDNKRNHENTVEIPVITTVEPKHEPKHKKK